jgi:hypothetical protein
MRATHLKRRNYQPWIWKLLFPGTPFRDIVFTWGGYMYTPLEIVPDDIVIHEGVHARQQLNSRFVGFFLVFLYKFCRPYRKWCEVEAFKAQGKYLKAVGKPYRHLALSLGSPLYKVMPYAEAVKIFEEL